MRRHAACFMLSLVAALAAAPDVASAQSDPFYKGKRLTLLINFAAGGPADIEGRLFARHFGKHIDGAPNIIVQNRDGAGGLVGTNYLGELGPRDGTMAGYLTAAAWNYVIDPAAYRVDFCDLRVRRLPAGECRLLHARRYAARHEGRSRYHEGDRARRRRARGELLEGPADPAHARHARRAVQIRHRLPLERAGAARACSAARSISSRNPRRAISAWSSRRS